MSDKQWPKPSDWPPPEGITEEEWRVYLNSDLRSMNKVFKKKVEDAMGWKVNDVADAEEIAAQVVSAVDKIRQEQGWDDERTVQPALIPRLRAALRLLENEHITPQGRRIIERILDDEEGRGK